MEANPLYLDLTKRSLSVTPGGSAFNFPSLTQGDSVTLGLRLTTQVGTGTVQVSRTVNSIRAVIGLLDARPENGAVALTIGDDAPSEANTTASIPHDAPAAKVAAAINALTAITALYGVASVVSHAGSWLVKFGTGAVAVEIAATSNTLFPSSFCRVRAYANGNEGWVHDIRLVQAPVSIADSFERIVPNAPTIELVRNGGTNGSVEWSEIQALVVPPQFVGTFYVQRGYRKTPLLSVADGIEEITAAVAALGDADEDETFTVTNPVGNKAHIEFSGDAFAGTAQPLLTVTVSDAPEGDITFTLPLTWAELHIALRAKEQSTFPLEIEATIVDEADGVTVRTVKLFRGEVVIKRELGYAELALAANRDWLLGPTRRQYAPFGPGQIITGQQHHVSVWGDGVATSFSIPHNLATESISSVTVRPNASNSLFLTLGTDYTAKVVNANSVLVTMLTGNPWATDSLAVVITSAGPASVFAAHTHTIEDVTGLRAELDALGTRLESIETLIPSGALETTVGTELSDTLAEWTVLPISEVFPARVAINAGASLAGLDVSKLPRERGLFPAVHDATPEALPIPLPTPAIEYRGRVFQNQTGGDVILRGGAGLRSVTIADDEFAACDGRAWYEVKQPANDAALSKSSYYPTAFERSLFFIHVDAKQLRLRREFRLDFGFEAALFRADTRAQWAVVVEVGTAAQASSPGIPGANFSGMEWDTTPLMDHRIILTREPSIHNFGVKITRALVGAVDTLAASTFIYGLEEVAATVPDSATFAIKGTLCRFDIEDSPNNAKGFIALRGMNVGVAGAEVGRATVK